MHNGHDVLAHHPGIITRLVDAIHPISVPFRLYHRTGFTTTLISYVSSLVQCGREAVYEDIVKFLKEKVSPLYCVASNTASQRVNQVGYDAQDVINTTLNEVQNIMQGLESKEVMELLHHWYNLEHDFFFVQPYI